MPKKNLYQKIIPFSVRRFTRAVFYLFRYFPQHFSYFTQYLSVQAGKKIDYEYNLAIAAIIKNEGPYLKEWIEYHRIVGVDKFIFHDNESDDNTKEILKPYILDGIVDYTWLPGKKMQLKANNDAIKKWKKKIKYIAIIDADEFIVPVQHDNILQVIEEIENESKNIKKPFVGLIMQWVKFGYNGHYTKPVGLLKENYTKSDVTSKYFKGIVNPRMVVYYNIHCGNYILNRFSVDENLNDVFKVDQSNIATINKIRINHYWTKSYEEFAVKQARGSVSKGIRKWELPEYDPTYLSRYEDRSIERFIPALKERLFNEVLE